MTKSPGSWFSLLWIYNSITKGMTEAFMAKVNNKGDTDERVYL